MENGEQLLKKKKEEKKEEKMSWCVFTSDSEAKQKTRVSGKNFACLRSVQTAVKTLNVALLNGVAQNASQQTVLEEVYETLVAQLYADCAKYSPCLPSIHSALGTLGAALLSAFASTTDVDVLATQQAIYDAIRTQLYADCARYSPRLSSVHTAIGVLGAALMEGSRRQPEAATDLQAMYDAIVAQLYASCVKHVPLLASVHTAIGQLGVALLTGYSRQPEAMDVLQNLYDELVDQLQLYGSSCTASINESVGTLGAALINGVARVYNPTNNDAVLLLQEVYNTLLSNVSQSCESR